MNTHKYMYTPTLTQPLSLAETERSRGGQLAAQLNDNSQPKFGAVARTSSAPRPESAGQVAGRPGPPLADPLAYKARPITMGPLRRASWMNTHKYMYTPTLTQPLSLAETERSALNSAGVD
eukprot:COSAG01_NODE_2128_length_8364_cov_100.246461_9_plen_121_part_00